jgi:FkbM family methyltransferase
VRKYFLKDRVHVSTLADVMRNHNHVIGGNIKAMERLYDSLHDDHSKDLLIDLISYRILGYSKVKLSTNTPENRNRLAELKNAGDKTDVIDPNFMGLKLNKFDLNKWGKDIKIYLNPTGVLVDFFIEQYRYRNGKKEISVRPGDVVLDAGGCWADTALYFADLAGTKGKVYSFEFIPNNLKIFQRNCDLNPRLKEQIEVVPKPVWSHSGQKVYFKDWGPGSQVAFESFAEADGQTETIAIDDFVEKSGVQKVDFIKMDIEGAEPNALEGARRVIEKYRPTLAIAIYHSPDDFVNIPNWILDLNLGYKLYLTHNTIHHEETVIFAQAHD